jgi:hypothetical protein
MMLETLPRRLTRAAAAAAAQAAAAVAGQAARRTICLQMLTWQVQLKGRAVTKALPAAAVYLQQAAAVKDAVLMCLQVSA